MQSINRFSTVAAIEDSHKEVAKPMELQYQYSLQDGMVPWLVQATDDELHLLKSLQSQWYSAWTKLLKDDKELIASRLCFGTDTYYVCMRTHGNIGVLYECETTGKDFAIKRPFIKIKTLDWLRQAVAPTTKYMDSASSNDLRMVAVHLSGLLCLHPNGPHPSHRLRRSDPNQNAVSD